jgi:hypothetical protein
VPEQQQATSGNEQSDWESRYKDLQAELTRKSQQVAEVERMKKEGKLIEKDVYDDFLVKWASENPEAALDVFPSLKQYVASQGGSNGSTARTGNPNTGAFDDAIYDENSDAHRKFRQEHGDKGWRQALATKAAPDILEATGLKKEMDELREFKETFGSELEQLRQRVDQTEKYSVSAYDQVQISQDPRRKQIRDMQEKLKADPNHWYEIVDKFNKAADPVAAVPAQETPAAPAASNQQPEATPPGQLAARIDQASVVPQGAGSGSGHVPSQAIDPLDAAIAKVDAALAQKLGIPVAA